MNREFVMLAAGGAFGLGFGIVLGKYVSHEASREIGWSCVGFTAFCLFCLVGGIA